jgi:hypothetical protein
VNQGTGEVILGVWVLLAWFFNLLEEHIPSRFCFGAGWVLDLVRKEGG